MTVRLKMWLISGLTLIVLTGALYLFASRIVLQGIANLQTLVSSGQAKEVISGLIDAEGKSVLRTLLLAIIGVGLFILALVLLLTERLILGRMARLSGEVSRISKESESARVELAGSDEIGRLASHINTMLNDLQQSNQNNLELEQRYRTLIEQAEEGFALIDAESFDFIDANEAFWRLVGRKPQEGRRLNLVDIFEMKDQGADFQKYFRKRVFAKEVQIHHPNGAVFDLEIIGNRGDIAGRAIIFTIARDISVRKQMEKDLEQRERYLALMVEVQRSLLAMKGGNFPQDFLGLLGRSIGASRVYVAQVHSGSGKEMRYSCTGEWLAAGVTSRLELPMWRDMALSEVFPGWLKAFNEAGIFNSTINGFGLNAANQTALDSRAAQDVRAALEGVKAFLVLPLMVKGELYGFLGFEDHRSGSLWHEPEVSLLKAIGSTLSLALERWLAEEASRHQASELEAVIHALPDIYLLIDSEGKILDYHLVGPTTPGSSFTIAIGKPLIQVLPAVIVRRIVDSIHQVHETGQPASLEYYLVEKDELIYYEARLSPLTGDQTIAIIRDITNRKRTEQALRLSESKYRQVVDSVHEVIFQTDLNGHLVFLNQAWSGITGYSIEESLGAALDSYIQEEDRPGCQEMINALRNGTRDGFQGEIRCLTTTGDVRWLAVVAHLTRDENGQAIGIAGTLADVTQGRQAEYERRRGEESIRGLYAIISSQEISFSEKIQALLGMGCEHFGLEMGILSHVVGDMFYGESVYSSDDQIAPGSIIDLCNTYCADTLKVGEPVGIEHTGASNLSPPGVTHGVIEAYLGTPVAVGGLSYGTLSFASVRPHRDKFTDADKEFLRLMAQWAGVEIERQQYIEQLEISADEIEVKNQALSEARDQALEAARLKSEFLATMSHEIRTPMNAVIGMAELLQGTNLSAEQRSYATMVTDSASVLLTLINDILDFSKIEAGKMALEKIEFDILAVVERVADLMAPKAAEKHLDLMTSVHPDIPTHMIGDPTRLQQILLNLVGNAIKFTRVGEVVVEVSLVNLTSACVVLHIEIYDTGIGLSETARNRLFQPFTQADGSTNRKYGGTGLGLAISKRLVELMGGEIGVDSVEGQGSTFWFTARCEPAFISEEETVPAFENLQSDERVLVVVTNVSQRMILKNYLTWEGIRVDSASDTREALTMLQVAAEAGRPFKVMIIDQRLGKSNWIELTGKIWEMYGTQSIRLVALVEFDQRQAGEEAVRTGFAAYILKPVKKLDFMAAVRRALAGEDRRLLENVQPGLAALERKSVYPAEQQTFQGLVLLAEDNPGNQKLATTQLKKLGFEVTGVSDGRQAVEAVIADQARYTLVMMDCQMPDMDGFEATRLIRKAELSTSTHIPIIAMTANALEGDREFCLAAGMDDYIGKPVTLDNLRLVLSNWVTNHAKAEPAAQPEPITQDEQHDPLNQVILNGIRELQVEGEPDFLTELVDMYLQDSLLMVKSIHRAIVEKDCELLAQSAHRLKGNSSNLGARWLAGCCGELEEKARAGEVEDAAGLVGRFDQEYQSARKALIRLRKDTKNLDLL